MNEPRALPHNLDAEKSVLEAILRDNSTLRIARGLVHPRDFFRDANQIIFDRMIEMSDRGAQIDEITLCEELERAGTLERAGGQIEIYQIISGRALYRDASEYVTGHAERVAENSKLRRFISECGRALDWAYSKESRTEIAAKFQSAVEALSSGVVAAESPHDRLVMAEVAKQRANAEAKRRLASERFATTTPPAVKSLRQLIDEPDTPHEWLIDRLFPMDTLVMLVAMGKSGKTTLRNNVIRALVDGGLFLGTHPVNRRGPVFVFEMEMAERQTKKWLDAVGVQNVNDVHLVSLRGATETFNLFDPASADYWAGEVRKTGALTVMLDTLNPALVSAGMNEREDGGRYVRQFANFIAKCGASNGFICHHTGWATDRARGDSALLDVPDATWMLTRDKDDKSQVKDMAGTRSFQAYGRDVDFPKTDLVYHPDTRLLTLAAMSTQESKADRALRIVCGIVSQAPRQPLSQTSITEEFAPLEALAKAPAKSALADAINRGLVRKIPGAARGAFHHVLTPQGADFLGQHSSAPQRAELSGAVPLQRPTPYKGGAVDADETGSNSSTPFIADLPAVRGTRRASL